MFSMGAYLLYIDAPALATEESFCANNELEGFYGDLGAFRCLPTLAADVAFVDHLTPLLNTGFLLIYL